MKTAKNTLVRNRIFYGFGIVGSTIFDTFIGSFLTLYATDVLGLDALYFASLLIVPKIVDILIDFFIMYFVGKTRSKFGMYRPWLLNMVGLTLCFVTLFSVPEFNLSSSASLVIILISYFLSDSIFASFYWIPYAAIPGVITEDENELVKISSSRTIFDYVFSTLVSAATMPILLAFGGHKNPEGWMVAALILGLLSLVSSVLCFVFLKTDPELEKKMTKEYSFADVFKDYKSVITDKGFIVLTALMFFAYLAVYTNQTVSYYFYIYNLKAEEIIGYLALIAAAVSVTVSLLTSKLQKNFGFRTSLVIGSACLAAAAVLMMFTYNTVMLVVSGSFMVAGTTIMMILLSSLHPVVAKKLDPNKVKTPLNSTVGLSTALEGFAVILGNTLGAAIISFGRYDASLDVQNSYTLNVFRYCSPAIVIVLSAVMIAVILFAYNKGIGKRNENT